jgi:transcriptional regulator GlxA family with amidase domain
MKALSPVDIGAIGEGGAPEKMGRLVFSGRNFDPLSGTIAWEKLAEEALFDRQKLAQLCSISTRTLDRCFLRERNETAHTWMQELRMNLAWERLPAAQSVKEVAIALGYTQASQFSRDFKARFGIPPRGRWRRESEESQKCETSTAIPESAGTRD